jgi:aspartate/methionine/tyrosine aminotransferase
MHIFTTPGALSEHTQWYVQQRCEVMRALDESGLRYITPEGAFYACVALPGGLDSRTAAHGLADEYDVIAVPGVAFGAVFNHWLRLTWVSPPERVREGLRRIARFTALSQHANVGNKP